MNVCETEFFFHFLPKINQFASIFLRLFFYGGGGGNDIN